MEKLDPLRQTSRAALKSVWRVNGRSLESRARDQCDRDRGRWRILCHSLRHGAAPLAPMSVDELEKSQGLNLA